MGSLVNSVSKHNQLLSKFSYRVTFSSSIKSERDPVSKRTYRYNWCLEKFGKPSLNSPWYYWMHDLSGGRYSFYGFKLQDDATEFKLRFGC